MLKPDFSVLGLLKNPAYRKDGDLLSGRPPGQARAVKAAAKTERQVQRNAATKHEAAKGK